MADKENRFMRTKAVKKNHLLWDSIPPSGEPIKTRGRLYVSSTNIKKRKTQMN